MGHISIENSKDKYVMEFYQLLTLLILKLILMHKGKAEKQDH